MVSELGSGLGGVWESVWRSGYHGRVFLKHYDSTLQGTRSRVSLAKGSYQMVAISEPAAIEASSLRIRAVSKYFAAVNGAAVGGLALDKVSLFVSAGELVSVVGPSGCGKSTLLRLTAGLILATEGELLVGNEPITEPSAERGLVFQDPNLFPWLTVRRNIEAGLVARGVLREKRKEVNDFMRLVGLEAFADA